MRNIRFLFFLLLALSATLTAQYKNMYEIAGIRVVGNQSVDENSVILLSGLRVGQSLILPSETIGNAIKSLWKQNYFSDVKIEITEKIGQLVYLEIQVMERVRVSKFNITGVKSGDIKKLKEKISLKPGMQLSENLVYEATQRIQKYYEEKGYFNAQVQVLQQYDSVSGGLRLALNINKGKRFKIQKIETEGNVKFSNAKIRRYLKNTKQKLWIRFYKSSKFIREKFEEDKINLIAKYRKQGYRDASIVSDSLVVLDDKTLKLIIKIQEGVQYHFRNIRFVGNTVYRSGFLDTLLGIKKGDIYNQDLLNQRLTYDQKSSRDILGLYMNNGYLTASVQPLEVGIEKDSIDLEIRIREGEQYRIGRIFITGNDKTKDYVIQRSLYTLPGELFSRENIIRTQTELSSKGYFNAEKIGIEPIPHPEDNTVDIRYTVEETSSDQVELSAGWGGYNSVIASVGLVLKNFSLQDIFKKEAWRPLPAGAGQELSLKISATGLYYQNYSFQFTEPWLGGKKPHSFTLTGSYSLNSNNQTGAKRQSFAIIGASVGFGQRLTFPDDYFTLQEEIGYQHYNVNNYSFFSLKNGKTHNFNISLRLQRKSIDHPVYPRSGSHILLSGQFTPPYSFFMPTAQVEKIKETQEFPVAEYYKIKFATEWFTPLTKDQKLVLRLKAGFGYLGYYNAKLGLNPFERFAVGGNGLTGIGIFYYGREIVAFRGYDDEAVNYKNGSAIVAKYTAELRYPIIISPSATIFALAFAEAANTWMDFKNFNPFNLKRSAGLGLRIFLPIVGMLGLDYAWTFDNLQEFGKYNASGTGRFVFTLGFQVGDL
jgi:outer membrane protein insertion porin family